VGSSSGASLDARERVDAALAEPMMLEGSAVPLRAAIGVATFPGDGADAPALLAHADRGMYAAKPARGAVREAGGVDSAA
jgi:GGDEF domain-containing protein